jgi:hypothetical protein
VVHPHIAQTCKQFHKDASILLYEKNQFDLGWNVDAFERFVKQIGPVNCATISEVWMPATIMYPPQELMETDFPFNYDPAKLTIYKMYTRFLELMPYVHTVHIDMGIHWIKRLKKSHRVAKNLHFVMVITRLINSLIVRLFQVKSIYVWVKRNVRPMAFHGLSENSLSVAPCIRRFAKIARALDLVTVPDPPQDDVDKVDP